MYPPFKKTPIVFALFAVLLPLTICAQNKKTTTIKEVGVIENGVIRAEKFGLKPGETKAKQTKALQAIVDLYADNVPHNSWDINLQNPEPTIIIPAGEYNVGEIELRSYVTIRGTGRGSTVLKGATFKAEKQYNITIEDLSIVGNVGATKESAYDLNSKKHSSAFKFTDCARLIFKNVSIKNHDVAFDNYNTYLVDLYSCFISYCNVCFMNDGKGNGYGNGHAGLLVSAELRDEGVVGRAVHGEEQVKQHQHHKEEGRVPPALAVIGGPEGEDRGYAKGDGRGPHKGDAPAGLGAAPVGQGADEGVRYGIKDPPEARYAGQYRNRPENNSALRNKYLVSQSHSLLAGNIIVRHIAGYQGGQQRPPELPDRKSPDLAPGQGLGLADMLRCFHCTFHNDLSFPKKGINSLCLPVLLSLSYSPSPHNSMLKIMGRPHCPLPCACRQVKVKEKSSRGRRGLHDKNLL